MIRSERESRLAPVVLFVYKRLEHARRTLETPLRNPELADSPFTVFCDGPRTEADRAAMENTRAVIRELAPSHTRVVERDRNNGLANSIIAGVSRLCEEYGRVIVIEDDLRVSPVLLRYFNKALDAYADEEKVMHISGYMFPVTRTLPSAFFIMKPAVGDGLPGRGHGENSNPILLLS